MLSLFKYPNSSYLRLLELLCIEMCSCFGSSSVVDKELSRKEELQEETVSFSVSTQLKDITVRIVHPGGRIEMYRSAISASKLIQKYPGMCIARPCVFKHPHESILSSDDILLPGNKYFVIGSTTVEKLKRRISRKGRMKESVDRDEPMLEFNAVEDVGDNYSEESICSAKDYFVSKDSWSNRFLKKHVKEKKRFVPPIQRPKIWKELEWEPSLTSIQELSP